jgi:hypothetical protein
MCDMTNSVVTICSAHRGTHQVFDEMPLPDVVWDEKLLQDPYSCGGVLQLTGGHGLHALLLNSESTMRDQVHFAHTNPIASVVSESVAHIS